jgi:hypothetical protein
MTTSPEPFTAYQDPSPVPYSLTPQAEALLDAEPEAEARAMTAAPEPYPVLAASDLVRFEPTPYDLGITDDPEATPPDFPDVYPGARPSAEAACQALAGPEPEAEIEAGL